MALLLAQHASYNYKQIKLTALKMNYEQIKELIEKSLLEIYYRDNILLNRNVREECVNHRLAFYFEMLFTNIIRDDMLFTVDLEYNKNIDANDKQIKNESNQIISIRPDIIIHKRDSNNENLLAVEAKLRRINTHDFLKLEKLLYPPYNYKYSAAITYLPKKKHFTAILFRRIGENIESETFIIKKQ